TVYYEEIWFCSGSIQPPNKLPHTPNEISVPWSVSSTPVFGYVFSAVVDTTYFIYLYDVDHYSSNNSYSKVNITYFNTTGIGAHSILKNNTLLFSLRDGNSKSTSWSLLAVQLQLPDCIYGNRMIANVTPRINSSVDLSTTKISVNFSSPVYLSTGNITIYQASNHSIRQRVSVTSEFCKLSNDGMVVNISIIDSTFNEYGEKYYVKIDNNFAKAKDINEPLRGIESEVWILKSETAATGLAVLTMDASKKFLKSSGTDQSAYFDILLDDLAYKVPVSRERLSSNKNFQNFDGQIFISIHIELPIDGRTENTVPGVFSNLNSMILNKEITTFSTGVTNELNSTFGFRPIESPWDNFKSQIIAAI
ncbi:28186_t:CDS:2, partial [Racocetra persica]